MTKEENITQFNIMKRILLDSIIGALVMWLILWGFAKMSLTQFGGLISDMSVALMTSLAASIIILVIYIILVVVALVYWKRPFLVLGSLLAFILLITLSTTVQQGFNVFFAFI